MTIAGVSIVLLLGIVNLILVVFQVSTGKKWVKVHFAWHRRLGLLLLFTALIHAVLAYLSR
ncbi:MAG: hypothetical protein HPY46_02105 [Candidatus Aminicenantes bacterium]|jgi:hypothetical protein|uniref:Uncharacterized protein n=1 Tax=Candidatus Saccharicenans subterraneus TaxID=2508984 RepID=A0A3E2BK98_9BACT|nr:hypothetical protein [Clostridiales bacterium]NPV82365.1 hypothetical protein [Candidatus Aminicenantes bacterium]RFT15114.1 MAG: hypothetical protein OP8BY_0578 [Candidatus Saccharicenans subterraneum]